VVLTVPTRTSPAIEPTSLKCPVPGALIHDKIWLSIEAMPDKNAWIKYGEKMFPDPRPHGGV